MTAFRDINPQMPLHVLVVPNQHIADTEALEPEHDALVGAMVRAAQQIARQEGVSARGYRLVFNTGRDANNTVPHLHLHVLGGRPMSWPRVRSGGVRRVTVFKRGGRVLGVLKLGLGRPGLAEVAARAGSCRGGVIKGT